MSEGSKVVLVTGASSGIGKAIAVYLTRKGHRVYGTSRGSKPGIFEESPGMPAMLYMDVTEDNSVKAGIAEIFRREGRLDVVINNAGYILSGAVEETTLEEAKANFDTIFFGTHRVCRAVLPLMRRAGGGCIINISSLVGLFAVPFHGFYSAAKFALEGLMEALRMEAASFGIRIVLIEPGDLKTGLTANRVVAREAEREDSPYRDSFRRSLGVMVKEEQNGPLPDPLGPLVEKIIQAGKPRLHYTFGKLSQTSGIILKKVLPQRLFESSLMGYYRMK